AMGAAAGRDSRHRRGYAYLFVGGNADYKPAHTYTWKQAREDGARSNACDPGSAPSSLCNVPVLIGRKLAGASRAIAKAHCSVGEVVSKHAHYVPGIVIRQYPAWCTTLARGASIRLTVSLGPR